MNMEQVLQTFYDESRELLTDMESILLDLESRPEDNELRNALFRCVHTVKGSSGMFGFDHVVTFTHVVENILDRLRAEDLDYSRELAQVLLQSRDHIKDLIEINGDLSESLQATQQDLLARLNQYQSAEAADKAPTAADPAAAAPREDVDSDLWHISLVFDPDVLRHGMDPLGFVRFLQNTGELVAVHTLTDALPPLAEHDGEACYLAFEITLKSAASMEEIRGVFEFVEELCTLTIIPPGAAASVWRDWLNSDEKRREQRLAWLQTSGELSAAALQQLTRPEESEPTVAAVATRGTPEKATGSRDTAQHFIRVPAKKLDELITLVGELVITSSSAAVTAIQSGDKAMREITENMSLLVDEIRDTALDLRMVPIGECFQRFQRIIRDVSTELEKDIHLSIHGAETELDKSLVEKIVDPLTHLVRNACDHGIEKAEARLASGKPAQGVIELNAWHQGNNVMIEISDDGNGLDRERIRAKALEKGLITADQVLSDREVFNLIFEPGFSTAAAVTNLSGRGVGMDVVKKSIQALRGTIEVLSTPGKGSTFRLRLPLTLAIIDGFVSTVGDAVYVIPLESVVECIEFTAEDQQEAANRQFINLRGEVLPFIRLQEYFQAIPAGHHRRSNIVVVSHAGKKVGLVVDTLLGEHQTVIKPLGKLFSHLQGLAGSTIMGNGQVALVLDVATLIQQVMQSEERLSGRTEKFH